MKYFALFAITCLACILKSESYRLGSSDDEKNLVKRFSPFGLAYNFTCDLAPWQCNEKYLKILDPFVGSSKNGNKNKAKDEDEEDDKDKDKKDDEKDDKKGKDDEKDKDGKEEEKPADEKAEGDKKAEGEEAPAADAPAA